MSEAMRVTVERLGHKGDGIAPGPVFVPGILPGEEVEGLMDGDTLSAPKIVTPSVDRVAPPCRHAKACGGCQLQHASDGFVEGWKLDVVRRALDAQGIETPIDGIATSPRQSRRRATFSAKRTKKGALAGFHQKGSDVVIDVPDCLLVTTALNAALPMVQALAVLGASRKGELSVTVTETRTGLDVAVTGGKEIDTQFRSDLADLARAHDLARLTWEDESLTRRPPILAIGKAEVTPPPGAFLQATAEGETALLTAVRDALKGASNVADLFAGCGTFALPLAEQARIHAVEGEKTMVKALDHGWRNATGLKHVTSAARDLFRNPLLPDELQRFDGVVIDPPRAGAEAQIEQIAKTKIPRIAHVSCNPVTFARDSATLIRNGWKMTSLRVVDQFRWSTHLELVAAFDRS